MSDMKKMGTSWRGLDELEASEEYIARAEREFPEGASELEVDGVSRRRFMGLMGASMALAGASVTGCIRKPEQKVLPFAKRPEDVVPGKPLYFRTAMNVGERVLGLHVESQDGRPTKVEGNPEHPMSGGKTDAWAQGSVLDLYDRDRAKDPHQRGAKSDWASLHRAMADQVQALKGNFSEVAVLTEAHPSPTLERLLGGLRGAKVYVHDQAYARQAVAGVKLATGKGALRPLYQLSQADVIAGFDSDFLGVDGDVVRNTREYTAGRLQGEGESAKMNRLYVAESTLSVTGMMADERLPRSSSVVGAMLRALGAKFGLTPDVGDLGQKEAAWVDALHKDLQKHQGRAVVLVGERQPAWAHALGYAITNALASQGSGKALSFVASGREYAGGIEELSAAIGAGSVKMLVMLGTNPVYDAPADLGFASVLAKVPFSVHLSSHVNETSKVATWTVPRSHYLERWGDLRSTDGTVSLVQPLVAPLFDALSEIELVDALMSPTALRALEVIPERDAGYARVRETASSKLPAKGETAWRRALFRGVLSDALPASSVRVKAPAGVPAEKTSAPTAQTAELNFILDASVCDGRFANNGWLQEMPDPATKLTWDNALLVSPRTAGELGVKSSFDGATYLGDWASVKVGSATVELPVMVTPGMPDWVFAVSVGYGRGAAGQIAAGAGQSVSVLRTRETYYRGTAQVAKLDRDRYPLATTQEHWSMRQPGLAGTEEKLRDMVMRQNFALSGLKDKDGNAIPSFKEDPKHLKHWRDHIYEEYVDGRKLFDAPQPRGEDWFRKGQQWAMAIDLNRCTGCSACLVACVAENNIPVVGKEEVLNGREMHWIRIDRYYTGVDPNEPDQMVVQPVSCQHCENAPCETVCPVAATQHSDSGMNDMAYNRCIGTRYCANNCPYKVRRFNFHNYQKRNHELNPLFQMARNPDVSVRFRGVMEKCSFCVQRVTGARIDAKARAEQERRAAFRAGDAEGAKATEVKIAPDGVMTACQQACPADAIAFGDMLQEESTVSKWRRDGRNYEILSELATRPRVSYLGRLRNRNPELSGEQSS